MGTNVIIFVFKLDPELFREQEQIKQVVWIGNLQSFIKQTSLKIITVQIKNRQHRDFTVLFSSTDHHLSPLSSKSWQVCQSRRPGGKHGRSCHGSEQLDIDQQILDRYHYKSGPIRV